MANKITVILSEPAGRTDGVGVDHQIEMWYFLPIEGEDEDLPVPLEMKTLTIPLADMEAIRDASSGERNARYKQAIEDNMYFQPVAEPMPPKVTFFDYDEYDAYIVELQDWTARKVTNVGDCATLATLADNYIRSLATFTEYPFEFEMRT